jgi:hypothetical protein
MQIITNHKPRFTIDGFDLNARERAQFDYYDSESLDCATFFRYRGAVYDVAEFMRAPDSLALLGWHGYASDSYFSGTLIRLIDNGESVIVARFYC